MNMWTIGLMGCLAEGIGLLTGILLMYLFKVTHKRFIGMLFGGTSGLMIAVICFDVLPEALLKNRIDLLMSGILIGVLTGLLLDETIPVLESKIKVKSSKTIRTGIVLILGIGIHNIPEGFALGALGSSGREALRQFAIILALHSVPEGIALAISFYSGRVKLRKIIGIPLILGFIMGIAGIVGYRLSSGKDGFVSIALGIAAGIILYIVCEELIPESRKVWNGRMTTVATIVGIILGLLLVR